MGINGEEDKFTERVNLLKRLSNQYGFDQSDIGTPDDRLIVLHCLPAFHDTNTVYGKKNRRRIRDQKKWRSLIEVFRSKYGRQFEEAENRMHSIKAIMAATLGNLFIPRGVRGRGIP